MAERFLVTHSPDDSTIPPGRGSQGLFQSVVFCLLLRPAASTTALLRNTFNGPWLAPHPPQLHSPSLKPFGQLPPAHPSPRAPLSGCVA